MSFKLSLKQLIKLLLVSLGLALVLSMLATWLDPQELFKQTAEVQWSLVWETMSSWFWPLWMMFAALGYVFMMVYRIVNS